MTSEGVTDGRLTRVVHAKNVPSTREAVPGFSNTVRVMRLDHLRLDVSDLDRAEAFYRSALDLEVVVRYDLPQRTIMFMAPEGRPPGIELWREAGLPTRPHPTHHVAFVVDDVRAAVERVRAAGYPILEEAYRIGKETVSFVSDPDGHLIELNDFLGRDAAGAPGR